MLSERVRVFGIGLSKTGTSSLGEALNLLGVRTIHFPFDEDTYLKLTNGRVDLAILDVYQGVVDIPVAPFYKQLDAAYPGSRFVLTVRDAAPWLRSVELHWELMTNWWDRYPDFKRFQEFISRRVYGSVEFSRDRFLSAYESHVRGVRAYFAGRPESLLEIDICSGGGWETLCPFLESRVPNVAFPHANEWMHQLLEATRELNEVVPEDSTVLLVDQAAFGRGFGVGRRVLPFLERDGSYDGDPLDDAHALEEFRRALGTGVRFVVFGWPAFWWFDYYPQFTRLLRSTATCRLESPRLAIFELNE